MIWLTSIANLAILPERIRICFRRHHSSTTRFSDICAATGWISRSSPRFWLSSAPSPPQMLVRLYRLGPARPVASKATTTCTGWGSDAVFIFKSVKPFYRPCIAKFERRSRPHYRVPIGKTRHQGSALQMGSFSLRCLLHVRISTHVDVCWL